MWLKYLNLIYWFHRWVRYCSAAGGSHQIKSTFSSAFRLIFLSRRRGSLLTCDVLLVLAADCVFCVCLYCRFCSWTRSTFFRTRFYTLGDTCGYTCLSLKVGPMAVTCVSTHMDPQDTTNSVVKQLSDINMIPFIKIALSGHFNMCTPLECNSTVKPWIVLSQRRSCSVLTLSEKYSFNYIFVIEVVV